jgi:hypothetical protein
VDTAGQCTSGPSAGLTRHDLPVSSVDALAVIALTVVAVWLVGSCIHTGDGTAGRLLAGVLALLGTAWVGMLVSTLGLAVLGQRTGLRIATPIALVALLAVRRPRLLPPRPTLAAAAAGAVGAVILWPTVSAPANLLRGADTGWHDGWTHQLMGGATSPGGPYAGIPNAYPWLYHALAAWLAGLVPGSVMGAFLAIQVLTLVALGAGIWLLARELGLGEPAAGWAAVLVLGAAGVGWIWQHSPAAVTALKYGLGPYHGDFVLANAMSSGLGNLAPLVPREAALALVPAVLWLAIRAAAAESARPALVAGAAGGLAALLGPVEGSLAVAGAVAIALAVRRPRRLVPMIGAAAAIVAVWVIPLGLSYHAHGGLRQTTTQVAPDPSVPQATVALGVLLPLAAAGLVLLARRGLLRRELVACTGVAVAVCTAGAVVGSGHVLLGTPAILHWLRYLPVLAVTLAVPAGYAAAALVAAAAERAFALGAVVAAAVAATTMASTGLAAAAIRDHPTDPGLACSRPLPIGSSDTVAVAGGELWLSNDIGFWLFSRSGTHIVWLPPQTARVPFRRLPAGVPGETARRAEIESIVHGGTPPRGVGWVLTNRPATAMAADVHPYASCIWRRTIPLHLYRVEPG